MTTAAVKVVERKGSYAVTVAADKRTNIHNASVTKIARIESEDCPFVVACGAGTWVSVLRMFKWLDDGMPEGEEVDMSESAVIAVSADGIIYLAQGDTTFFPIEDPYLATGSGGDYAMGALATGASVERAVEVAALFDSGTGNGVDCVKIIIPKAK